MNIKMPTKEEREMVLKNVQDRIRDIHRNTITLRTTAAETPDVGHGSEADSPIVCGRSQDVIWQARIDRQHLVLDLNVSEKYHGRRVTVSLPDVIANLGNEGLDIEWVDDRPVDIPCPPHLHHLLHL